jgi:hypothetical protein
MCEQALQCVCVVCWGQGSVRQEKDRCLSHTPVNHPLPLLEAGMPRSLQSQFLILTVLSALLPQVLIQCQGLHFCISSQDSSRAPGIMACFPLVHVTTSAVSQPKSMVIHGRPNLDSLAPILLCSRSGWLRAVEVHTAWRTLASTGSPSSFSPQFCIEGPKVLLWCLAAPCSSQ